MNRPLLLSCIMAASMMSVLSTLAQSAESNRSRSVSSFDLDWRFLQAEKQGAESPAFDDTDWIRVDVPHDWSIAGPFEQEAPSSSGGAYLPSGISWYRRLFTLPASDRVRP